MVGVGLVRTVAVALAAMALAGCYVIRPCPDGTLYSIFLRASGMCEPSPVGTKGATDYDAYRVVYVEVLPDSVGGPELAQALAAHRDEAIALTVEDPILAQLGLDLADAWALRTQFFVDGLGSEALVTPEMIGAMENWLDRLASTGSPELAAAIAAGRAARPPLQSLVGVNMNAFRAAVLPPDRLFRNDFE